MTKYINMYTVFGLVQVAFTLMNYQGAKNGDVFAAFAMGVCAFGAATSFAYSIWEGRK